jgi:hypothetical protein
MNPVRLDLDYAAPACKTLLVTEFYVSASGERNHENLYCLGHNAATFDRVAAFFEATPATVAAICALMRESPTSVANVHFYMTPSGGRPTYADIIRFAATSCEVVVIANSDIFFDKASILLAADRVSRCGDLAVALSRWDITAADAGVPDVATAKVNAVPFSQDVWIFGVASDRFARFAAKIDETAACNYTMGIWACDNRFAYDMVNVGGYHVANPYDCVKIFHYHLSSFRTLSSRVDLQVPGPLHYVHCDMSPHWHIIPDLSKPEPSSFSVIATRSCANELFGLLLSVARHHPGAKVFISCDDYTKKYVGESSPHVENFIDVRWYTDLNTYTDATRATMERDGTFCNFLGGKARVMIKAIRECGDTLMLGSDMILMDPVNDVNRAHSLGVSPAFITADIMEKVGMYNGDMLWTSSVAVCEDWIEFIKTSTYFDQKAIDDLAAKYSFFSFGENYNVQTWRYSLAPGGPQEVETKTKVSGSEILYCHKPLKILHAHFGDVNDAHSAFKNFFLKALTNAGRFRELLIIYRVINRAWVYQIPPKLPGTMYDHAGDTFRELARECYTRSNCDVLIAQSRDGHCWLSPNIMLYDRDDASSIDSRVANATLVLVGNGNAQEMAESFRDASGRAPTVSPWTYWPRHPAAIENYMAACLRKTYSERGTLSTFIGNCENAVQLQHRQLHDGCRQAVEKFIMTYSARAQYTLSQDEYIKAMSDSKFGLCTSGYGSKCNREMECLALGTVILATNDVETDSFLEPLVEGLHFLRVDGADDIKRVTDTMSAHDWDAMSVAGVEWYMRNVHGKRSHATTLSRVLFK